MYHPRLFRMWHDKSYHEPPFSYKKKARASTKWSFFLPVKGDPLNNEILGDA